MQNTRRFGTIHFEMGSHIFIFEENSVVDKKSTDCVTQIQL